MLYFLSSLFFDSRGLQRYSKSFIESTAIIVKSLLPLLLQRRTIVFILWC